MRPNSAFTEYKGVTGQCRVTVALDNKIPTFTIISYDKPILLVNVSMNGTMTPPGLFRAAAAGTSEHLDLRVYRL
jgi:hypothetical protein